MQKNEWEGLARARIVSGMLFPGHTQLHTDWEWPENEATMYHNIRNEDFRNAAQQAFWKSLLQKQISTRREHVTIDL